MLLNTSSRPHFVDIGRRNPSYRLQTNCPYWGSGSLQRTRKRSTRIFDDSIMTSCSFPLHQFPVWASLSILRQNISTRMHMVGPFQVLDARRCDFVCPCVSSNSRATTAASAATLACLQACTLSKERNNAPFCCLELSPGRLRQGQPSVVRPPLFGQARIVRGFGIRGHAVLIHHAIVVFLSHFGHMQPRLRESVGHHSEVRLEHVPSVLPRVCQGHGL